MAAGTVGFGPNTRREKKKKILYQTNETVEFVMNLWWLCSQKEVEFVVE